MRLFPKDLPNLYQVQKDSGRAARAEQPASRSAELCTNPKAPRGRSGTSERPPPPGGPRAGAPGRTAPALPTLPLGLGAPSAPAPGPRGPRPVDRAPLRLLPPPPAPRRRLRGLWVPGRRATYPPRWDLRSGPRHWLRTGGGGDGEPDRRSGAAPPPSNPAPAPAAAPRRPHVSSDAAAAACPPSRDQN